MTTPTWQDEVHRAAALYDNKDFAGAEKIFVDICNRPDVGQADKAIMGLNLANVREQMGSIDGALLAFDDARIQSLQHFLFVQQSRAVFLIRVGRYDDAVKLIEELLRSDALNADGRKACEENLAIARQHGGASPSANPIGPVKYKEAPHSTW